MRIFLPSPRSDFGDGTTSTLNDILLGSKNNNKENYEIMQFDSSYLTASSYPTNLNTSIEYIPYCSWLLTSTYYLTTELTIILVVKTRQNDYYKPNHYRLLHIAFNLIWNHRFLHWPCVIITKFNSGSKNSIVGVDKNLFK